MIENLPDSANAAWGLLDVVFISVCKKPFVSNGITKSLWMHCFCRIGSTSTSRASKQTTNIRDFDNKEKAFRAGCETAKLMQPHHFLKCQKKALSSRL